MSWWREQFNVILSWNYLTLLLWWNKYYYTIQIQEAFYFIILRKQVAYYVFMIKEVFYNYIILRNCAGDKIEKNEMGWACGAYGWGEGGV